MKQLLRENIFKMTHNHLTSQLMLSPVMPALLLCPQTNAFSWGTASDGAAPAHRAADKSWLPAAVPVCPRNRFQTSVEMAGRKLSCRWKSLAGSPEALGRDERVAQHSLRASAQRGKSAPQRTDRQTDTRGSLKGSKCHHELNHRRGGQEQPAPVSQPPPSSKSPAGAAREQPELAALLPAPSQRSLSRAPARSLLACWAPPGRLDPPGPQRPRTGAQALLQT